MNPNDQTTEDDDIDIDPLAPVEGESGDLLETDDLDTGTELTAADRALLSDEELAALDGDDDDSDELPEDAPPPAPAVAAEAPATAAPQTVQAPAATGTLTDAQIDAAEAGLEAAKAAQKKIMEDYDDGELTAAERDAKLEEANNQIAQHGGVLRQAEDAFNARKQDFTAEATKYLTEYPFLMEDGHVQAFDRIMREVSVSPLAAGQNNRQMLETAHRRYQAEAALYGVDLPMAAPPVSSRKAQAAAQPAPKPKTPLAPKAEPPRTLASIPSAALTGTADGKYSSLQAAMDNSTDPYVLEGIMARMSPEEREAFASMDV